MSKSIELKFGVLGGGSISGQSGQTIASQINNIVNQIESRGITSLKFRVDPASLNVIKTQLGSIGSAASTKDLTAGLSKLETKYKSLGASFADIKATAALDQMKKSVTEINRLRSLSDPSEKELASLKQLEQQWRTNTKVVQDHITAVNQQKAAITRIAGSGANSVESHYNEAQQFYQYGSLGSDAAGATALNVKMQELNSKFSAYNALKSQADVGFIEPDDITLLETYGNEIRELSNEIRNLSLSAAGDNRVGLSMSEMESFSSIQRQAKALANIKRLYGDQIDTNAELRSSFEQLEKSFTLNFTGNGYVGFENTAQGAKLASTSIQNFRTQLENSGVVAQSFGNKVKELFTKHIGTTVAMAAVTMLVQSFRQLYQNIVDIDKAMTELKKVTSEVDQTYSRFLDNAIKKSKELGTSVADYINATADFARLGYTINQADSLATAATVYKNVGDGIEDITMASESIIATMKAFGIEAENAMDIVDAFNEVGNNFAISSTGIGEALLRSASSLDTAGNSMAESIALITAANSAVQNPEKVGTTLKTVTMFLRAAKDEAEEAGESTEGMANSVSELRDSLLKLTNNKVDIMVDDTKFKSTVQILRELSQVWNSLTDIDQANILEKIGGKRNANVLSSLLTNFDAVEKVLITIENDAGSAMAEHEKWLNSIEGKTSEFKASFEALSVTVLSSDLIKGIVSFGTTVLNTINSIISAFDGIPAKVVGVIVVVSTLIKTLSALSKTNIFTSISSTLLSPIAGAITSVSQAGLTFGNVFSGIATGARMAGQSILSALGPGVWVALAAAAIYAVVTVWDKFTKSLDDIQADIEETKQEISDNDNKIETIDSQILENQERINMLKKENSALSKAELGHVTAENEKLTGQKALLEQINEEKKKLLQNQQDEFTKTATTSGMLGGSYYDSSGKEINEHVARFGIWRGIEGIYSMSESIPIAIEELSQYEREYDSILEKKSNGVELTEEEIEREKQLSETIVERKGNILELYNKIIDSGTSNPEMLKLAEDLIAAYLGYDEALQKIKNGLNSNDGLSKTDATASLKAIFGAEYDGFIAEYEGDVIAAAKAVAEMDTAQIAAAKSSEELENKTSSLSSTIEGLKSASQSISTLSKAYEELNDDGEISFSTIADIQEEFANVDGIENYVDALLDAKTNSKGAKSALSDLTEEVIAQKIATGELTSKDEKLLASMLKEQGYANAAEVAHKRLNGTITITADQVDLLGEAFIDQVGAVETANGAYEIERSVLEELGGTVDSVATLIAAKQAGLTDVTIQNVNARIEAIKTEVEAYLALAQAANAMNKAMPGINLGDAYGTMYSELNQFFGNDVPDYDAEKVEQYFALEEAIKEAQNSLNNIQYAGGTSGGSGGSSSDPNLDAWEKALKEQQHLLEMDKITKEEYYDWIRNNYKKHLSDTEKYADDLMALEEELYNWEKERIQSSMNDKVVELDYKLAKGDISEKDYFKEVDKVYTEGYEELQESINELGLYGVDTTERLEAETEFINNVKEAHISAYEAEKSELEHLLAMNLITEEQYLIELQRLYAKYYQGNEMYAKEAMEAEEEIYKKQVETIEKWAQAAADAVESIASAAEDAVQSVTKFIDSMVDAHDENFNLDKGLLDHALAMNYISEEEYYDSLEKLYKDYYKDKNLYIEQYWENQEAIYQHEQDALEESAEAIEDIHAKVIDMIKAELEDAIDAIEKTKEHYLDLIDLRREALNENKDEEDYQKEREKQVQSIAELQRQLNALSRDTSAAGIKKYKEVLEELNKAEASLADFDRDRAYEIANEQLDNEEDAFELEADLKTESLQKKLDDNEYLVQEAWDRMSNMSEELFTQLEDYTKKHSTSIKDEITDVWKTATDAVGDYANAYNAYLGINNQIGAPGITEGEYSKDEGIVGGKKFMNYTEPVVQMGADMLKIGTDLMTDFTGILSTVIDSPFTKMLDLGANAFAGIAQAGAGILMSVTGLLGGFAGGTNYVPKTGWYQTDELGDELKLIKDKSGNQYRLLTEGSKVIDAESTARLMKIIQNPELLTGRVANIKVKGTEGYSAPQTNQCNQTVVIQNTFKIKSSTPEAVASEIEKLMPKIANYTINNLVTGSGNAGVKRKIQHLT